MKIGYEANFPGVFGIRGRGGGIIILEIDFKMD